MKQSNGLVYRSPVTPATPGGPTVDLSEIADTDPFGDVSLQAQYTFDNNDASDNTGNYTASYDSNVISFPSDEKGYYKYFMKVDLTQTNSGSDLVFDSGIPDNLVDAFTFTFLVNISSTTSGDDDSLLGSVSVINDSSTNGGWYLHLNEESKILMVGFTEGGDSPVLYSNIQFPYVTDTWYYVMISYDKTYGVRISVRTDEKEILRYVDVNFKGAQLSSSFGIIQYTGSIFKLDQLEYFNKVLTFDEFSILVQRKIWYGYRLASILPQDTEIFHAFLARPFDFVADISDSTPDLSTGDYVQFQNSTVHLPYLTHSYVVTKTGSKYQSKLQFSAPNTVITSVEKEVFGNHRSLLKDPFGDNSCIHFFRFENTLRDDITGKIFASDYDDKGVSYIEGSIGKSLSYSVVSLPLEIVPLGVQTFTFWLKTDTVGSLQFFYVGGYYHEEINVNNNTISLQSNNNQGSGCNNAHSITVDSEQYVFCVRLGDLIQVYNTAGSLLIEYNDSCVIPAIDLTSFKINNGSICVDQLRLFNRTLESDEIQYLIQEVQ